MRIRDWRRAASALFGAGSLAALVGSLLPWQIVAVSGPDGRVTVIERTALHGDGALTLGASGAALAVAVFGCIRPTRRAQLFGMVALGGAVTWISAVVRSNIGTPTAVGVGLDLVVAGGIGMLAGTVFFTWALGRAPPDSTEGPLPIVKE